MSKPGTIAAGMALAAWAALGPLGAAAPAPTVAPPGTGLAGTLAAALDRGMGRVEARLGSLDGGLLSLALGRAARAGRPLRLVLDPEDRDSRGVGRSLAAISPTVEVRWRAGLRFRGRLLDVEGVGAWTWGPSGASLRPCAEALAGARFRRGWGAAQAALPRAVVLREQLEALPDPTEGSPHYVRRAAGAGAP